MSFFKIAATTAALIAALPAAASTTINFDQLPGGATLPAAGTTISNQYQSLGVTFSGTNTVGGYTGPVNSWGLIQATGPAGSGNYLMNIGAIPAGGPSNYLIAPRYNIMSLIFTDPTSDISFGLSAGTAVTINAYNGSGTLLQSLTNVLSNSGFTLQTLSATGVAKVEIVGAIGSSANSASIFGIDNLTFTSAPAAGAVPEPATWAMMMLGFGAMGAAMRRRTKVTARIRLA